MNTGECARSGPQQQDLQPRWGDSSAHSQYKMIQGQIARETKPAEVTVTGVDVRGRNSEMGKLRNASWRM